MATGTVKLFFFSRRYGFIRDDVTGEDIFVHLSTVHGAGLETLRKGQKVSFEVYDNLGKSAAKNVQMLEMGSEQKADASAHDSIIQPLQSHSRNGKQTKQARQFIGRADLEQILTNAVRNSHPDCATFVRVIIERLDERPAGGANWTIRGVKYGKADPGQCSAALKRCASEEQHKYDLSDDELQA